MKAPILARCRLPPVIAALLAAASLWFGPWAYGFDGEDMAPDLARLTGLTADGRMTIAILDRTYSGSWRRASLPEVALLRAQWRGTRQSLEAQRERLALAHLRGADGTSVRCEFVDDPAQPFGVCEEAGSRLYYLVDRR